MNKFYFISIYTIIFIFSQSFESSEKNRILHYNSIISADTELRNRVLTTVACEDCKDIPKCENAGKVICNDNECYQLMHNGIKVLPDCYYGKWMTLLIELLQGHHEPQEEKAFYEVLQYLPKNSVMVELGCYWGYYSIWFQKEISGAVNYLIEPDYKNLLLGKTNFSLNEATGDFTHAMIGGFSAESQAFINWDYETSFIKQIAIDDFARIKNIEFIHILHSDIQGAEVDMLNGCKQLIAENRIGYLFLSTHRGTHEKCLKALEDTDFEVLLSITREESFSADGLIIAKSPNIEGPTKFNVSRRSEEFRNFIESLANEKADR